LSLKLQNENHVTARRLNKETQFAFQILLRTFIAFLQLGYLAGDNDPVVQAIHPQTDTSDKKQAIYNLFAAYIHTIPPEELIESADRARRDTQLRYVVIYGAACSYCLGRAERLDDRICGRLRLS